MRLLSDANTLFASDSRDFGWFMDQPKKRTARQFKLLRNFSKRYR